jgi:hypothetical protein
MGLDGVLALVGTRLDSVLFGSRWDIARSTWKVVVWLGYEASGFGGFMNRHGSPLG